MGLRRRRKVTEPEPVEPLLERIDRAEAAQRRASQRVSDVLADVRVALRDVVTEPPNGEHHAV
jgi:hypothetical protein